MHWEAGVKPPAIMAKEAALAHGINAILEDFEGNLWIASAAGLFEFRAKSVETLGMENGLPVTKIFSVSRARAGGIWVGGEKATVFRLSNEGVERLVQVGAIHNHVYNTSGVLEDLRNRLFGLTSGPDKLHQYVGGRWFFQYDTELYGDALYEDQNARLWLGGLGGVACHDGEHWRYWSQTNGLPRAGVHVIHQASDGRMWFGTRGAGLVGLDEHHLKIDILATTDGPGSDEVWTIHESADGALWIGGNRGLARMEKHRDKTDAIANKEIITSLTSVPEMFSFTSSHGLPQDSIYCILEDREGYLWMSGTQGIHRVSRAELEGVARGKQETASCVSFGVADGMETCETNGRSTPSGCVDADGSLWFPTSKGLIRIEPDKVHINTHPPVVVLEEVWMGERRLVRDGLRLPERVSPRRHEGSQILLTSASFETGGKPLKLRAGRGQLIQFRYTAPAFINVNQARFRYRLRGLSEDWMDAGKERLATFVTLRPGDYVFEVTASNGHGVWAERPATFAFSLTPSFVQTAWFPASLALGGASLAGGIVMLRLRWQRRSLSAEHAAAMAEERARIAQDLHDDLGTALTGVALQLDAQRRGSGMASDLDDGLGAMASRVRALAARMREVVWAVNPQCDSVSSLAGFLEQQAALLLTPAGIEPRMEFPEEVPDRALDSRTRHHLALAVREALTNVVRHSGATETRLSLYLDAEAESAWIEIEDNGRGFAPERVKGSGQG
ncbi:MAG: ATP-binding protein, partial [Verrucomicrobiae bacterium]|nr:ATP-binding protein [Verrucomicrobiae bacterium]